MREPKRWPENEARFKELILYICQKFANDPKFGVTKLNKILYFCDFLAYAQLGEPITGFEYQKLPKGPAPRRIMPIREQMTRAGEFAIQPVHLVSGWIQERPVNLRASNLGVFTPMQIALVDEIIETLRDATAEDVSELSHRMVGWKAVDRGDTIPYETIFISDEPPTKADIARAIELAKTIQ